MLQNKVEIFFSKLFPIKILENEIVSTILYRVSQQFSQFKTKMNNILNNDI